MPAKRKSYSRKRPLSYAAFALGKEFDNAQKSAKLAADLGGITPALGQNALANAQQRIAARQMFGGRGLYEGRGSFLSDVESVGHRFLTKGIPNMVKAGGALKGLFGRGMYSGRGGYGESNEVMAGGTSSSAEITSAGDETGSICITNREYVGDIYAPATSGTFDVVPFPLNPGLEQSFPWLSQLAANYEEYEFIQLVFEFKSSIQDVNSTNGQVGTIITATNYNSSQPLFSDKPQMAAYYGSVSGKTTDDQTHGVECDPAKLSGSAGSYIRTNPVLTGEDLKGYDHGIFQLATHNIPSTMANGTLGELFVYYKVLLRKPKFLTGRGAAITRALFVSGAGTESNLLVMGTQAGLLKGQQNNLAVKLDINPIVATLPTTQTLQLTIPAYFAGNLEIRMLVGGTGLNGNTFNSFTLLGNVTQLPDIYGDGGTDSPEWFTNSSGTISPMYLIMHVRVQPATNAVNNVIRWTTALSAGTVTQSSIDVFEYNTSFNDQVSKAPILVNNAGVIVVP